MTYKIIILLLFLAVLASLASGFYFLMKDQGKTRRTVNSLAVRLGLATLLMGVLIYGLYNGKIGNQVPWEQPPPSSVNEQISTPPSVDSDNIDK